MMKKILALLLTMILLVSLSACGKNSNVVSENSEISNNSQQEALTEETANTSNEEENSSISTSNDKEETELINGMRPEFKEAMDSYEAFYDEYCDFMKEYADNPSDLTLLSEYTDMMSKAADMSEKFDAWNEDEMNDAELKYYLDVNNRVAQELLEVAQ